VATDRQTDTIKAVKQGMREKILNHTSDKKIRERINNQNKEI